MDPAAAPDRPVHSPERYRFDGVLVDAVAHTLTRDGEPQLVEPKAFAVLLILLRQAGQLVGRDQLLDAVWGHRHVTPGVLTRAIAQLRAALADRPQAPRYIQTQHALGYRFIGELLPGPDAVADPPPQAESGHLERAPPGPLAPADLPPVAAAAAPGRRRWAPRVWLAGGVALVAVAAIAWRLWPPPHPRAADASIAVRPFTSSDGKPEDRYFADGLAAEVRDALAGVPDLKVAAQPLADAASLGSYDAQRWGKTVGVASVLDANVTRSEHGALRLQARLTDTASGIALWTGSYEREAGDVFALQNALASEVVHELVGRLPGVDRQLGKRLTPTRDVGAYDDYLRGLSELQRPRGEGSYERALDAFGRALARDPQFARAQAGICRVEIARLESVSDAVAFQRARQACTQATRMDASLTEGTLAMADIARASGEDAEAMALYRQALADPALRADAYVGMARSEGARGHDAQALALFRQALALRPGDAQIYKALGYHHWLRGELAPAIQAYLSATLLQPGDSGLWSSLGGLYLANGDTAQAGRAFDMSLSIEPNAGALTNLGAMRFDAGDYAQAAEMFQRAATLQPDDYLHWGNLGDALAASPSTAARALTPYRRAAELAQAYLEVKGNDAYALAALAWYRANLGDRGQALAALKTAQATGDQPGEVALWCAQVLFLLDDQQGADRCVVAARGHGIPASRIGSLLKARGFVASAASPAS
ncbi:MAG TPA: winged helix-turn-helix domain-containing protein [Stenotrophomonas sp.]|nr:winged helix-turn-helix domain-containing protein [Stenotrophomonas sp.]